MYLSSRCQHVYCVFNFSYSEGCKVLSHCGFNCVSLMTSDVEYVFVCLLVIHLSSDIKCLNLLPILKCNVNNLKDILLGKSQTQNATSCLISFTWNSRKGKAILTDQWFSGADSKRKGLSIQIEGDGNISFDCVGSFMIMSIYLNCLNCTLKMDTFYYL